MRGLLNFSRFVHFVSAYACMRFSLNFPVSCICVSATPVCVFCSIFPFRAFACLLRLYACLLNHSRSAHFSMFLAALPRSRCCFNRRRSNMQIWAVTFGPLRQLFYRYIVVFKYSAACLLCQERSLTPSLGQGSPFSPFRHGPRLIITTCIFQTVTCIDILGRFGPRSCNVRLLWRY